MTQVIRFTSESRRLHLTPDQYYDFRKREIKWQSDFNEQILIKIFDAAVRFFTCGHFSLKYQVTDLKELKKIYTQISTATKKIQKFARETKNRKAATTLQAVIKTTIAQKHLRQTTAATTLQRAFRTVRAQKHLRQIAAATTLQTAIRTAMAQKHLRQTTAATTLQAFIRSAMTQKETQTKQLLKTEISQLTNEVEISDGHGEWIVSRNNGVSFEQVDEETYQKIFQLFIKYHPVKWALEHDEPVFSERLNRLKGEIEVIDPSLILTFVPRTIYELTFIKEYLKEDLFKINKHPCKNKNNPSQEELNEIHNKCLRYNNSWHLLEHLNQSDNYDNSVNIQSLAHRLNGVFCHLMNGYLENHETLFRYGHLNALLENYIDFFNKLHIDSDSQLHKRVLPTIGRGYDSSRLNAFTTDKTHGSIIAMGITHQLGASLLRKALSLESLTQKTVFYRGGTKIRGDYTHSYSFGMGPFSYCFHDKEATAYWYMRNSRLPAYALVLDTKELHKKAIYAPPEHALIQLFRAGEYHGRTMLGQDIAPDQTITGILTFVAGQGHGPYKGVPSLFKSDLGKEALSFELTKYYRQFAVQLK